jgi:tricorn protease
MLINGLAGSGGDAFPAYFRQAGLGPLIGERTWGGLVGIGGYPPLMDGASIRVPAFAYFDTDGTWGIEGHGVDPDIEVVPNPARLAQGVDEQLDRAIAEMLDALQSNPVQVPDVPDYPDRSGMGIAEDDK